MYFVLFCAFIALSSAKQTYIDVPAYIPSLLVEKSEPCIAETGADLDIMRRVLQWQFDNNETSKKFNFCLFKNSGLSDDAGHFYVDKILALYEYSNRKDEVANVTVECNRLVADNPLETMYKTLQCFRVKAPELVIPKTGQYKI